MSRPYSGMGDAVCVRRTGALRGSWDKLLHIIRGFQRGLRPLVFLSWSSNVIIDNQILVFDLSRVCAMH